MKVGLLGGTFNPIHNAHLRIARAAQEECGLTQVIFIPAADPPHKPLAGDVSFAHRAAMVKLAIAGEADFSLSLLEGDRGGKSYSIDTLRTFRQQYGREQLYFIIGGDSFLDIGSWHCYSELFNESNIIVVERPGCRICTPHEALPEAIRDHFRPIPGGLQHNSGSTVTFITGVPVELSSTEIRSLAATGADLGHVVPATVAAYISQQRIYYQCQ